MELKEVVAAIDQEIAILERARAVLSQSSGRAVRRVAKGRKRHTLSPEGRAKIVAAVKKRWAQRRKAAKT